MTLFEAETEKAKPSGVLPGDVVFKLHAFGRKLTVRLR
jgi:hypothetical protein